MLKKGKPQKALANQAFRGYAIKRERCTVLLTGSTDAASNPWDGSIDTNNEWSQYFCNDAGIHDLEEHDSKRLKHNKKSLTDFPICE